MKISKWLNHAIARLKIYLAGERNHVVLAHGEHLDVLYNNQLIVTLVKDRLVDKVLDILLVSLGEEQHGLSIAIWRGKQTLTVRVLSEALKDGAHCAGQLLLTF